MKQSLWDSLNKMIEEHSYNQTELCRGLCSNAALSRYLAGERRMDRLLLSALMQRMGKSPDKFVSVLSDAEYRYFDWRLRMLDLLADKDWVGAKRLLSEREKADKELNEPLQKQFYLMMCGVLHEKLRGDRSGAAAFFYRAVRATIPGFTGKLRPQSMLCVQEVNALLLWQAHFGNEEISAELLDFLVDYAYLHFKDEQEQVKVYPRLVAECLPYYFNKERYEEIYTISKRAFLMMTSLGYFICGEQVLGAYIESAEKLGKAQEVAKRKVQLASWCEMRRELQADGGIFDSGCVESTGNVRTEAEPEKNAAEPGKNAVMSEKQAAEPERNAVTSEKQAAEPERNAVTPEKQAAEPERNAVTSEKQETEPERKAVASEKQGAQSALTGWDNEWYAWDLWQEPELLREVIERRRKQRGLSQEALSEDICTPETLSRIETGKRAPSRRNYTALAKKLAVREDYYYSVIEADDFSLLEERFYLDWLIETRQWQKAKEAAERLEQQLDMGNRYNRQYLGEIYYLVELSLTGIPKEERMGRLTSILNLTIPEYPLSERVREWPELFWCTVFTSEEISIMMQMATALRHNGNPEDSIYLLERLYSYYKKSTVREEFHFRTFLGILAQLSILLGTLERYEECIGYSREGIALCFASRKILDMGLFVNDIATAKECLGDKAFALRYYRYAFYCEELLGSNSEIPRRSYKKLSMTDEELEWY